MLQDNYIAHLIYEMDVAADAHPSNYENFDKFRFILHDYIEHIGVVKIDAEYLKKYCEIENGKRNKLYHVSIHWENVKVKSHINYTANDMKNNGSDH